jgi:hypothetical protein
MWPSRSRGSASAKVTVVRSDGILRLGGDGSESGRLAGVLRGAALGLSGGRALERYKLLVGGGGLRTRRTSLSGDGGQAGNNQSGHGETR